MKRLYFLIAVLLLFVQLHAQNMPTGVTAPPAATYTAPTLPHDYNVNTGHLNYTRAYVPFFPLTDSASGFFKRIPDAGVGSYQVALTTTYYNGWGMPIQTIERGDPTAPPHPDIVHAADVRSSNTSLGFLPYTQPYGSQFQPSPFVAESTYYAGLYPGEGNTALNYSKLSYLSNTPTSVSYAPGASFIGHGKGVVTTSNIDDGTQNIKNYLAVNAYTKIFPGPLYHYIPTSITDLGYYPAGVLHYIKAVGQNNEQTIDYYDKNNRIVCHKTAANSGFLTTYYVYNAMGQLTVVIPPMVVAGGDFSALEQTAYVYNYNKYGQLQSSHVPGKNGFDYIVYDKKHRPVLTQSPQLAAQHQFIYSLYDSRNRVVQSGIYTDSVNGGSVWQSWLMDTSTVTALSGTLLYNLLNGVVSGPLSMPNCETDAVNYYDDYSHISQPFNSSYSGDYQVGPFFVTPTPYKLTNGLLTGSKTRVRDSMNTTSDSWTTSVYYYDQKGRLIQEQTINPWNNVGHSVGGTITYNWDVHTVQYNFAGQKAQDILFYNDSSTSTKPHTKIIDKYDYSTTYGSRLTGISRSIDGSVWQYVAAYTYDDLGNLNEKSMSGIEVQDYDYNIRGQLAAINRSYVTSACTASTADNATFGVVLDYDYGFGTPRYDGKLSGIIWRGAGEASPQRAYGYTYDAAGRMIAADFREYSDTLHMGADPCTYSGLNPSWNKRRNDYSVSNLSYDANGNMLSMTQTGTTPSGIVVMDKLTYSYAANSNTLQKVTDAIPTNYHMGEFVDGPCTTCNDYQYDADGNMVVDSNKKIKQITYNEQHLPLTTRFMNGGQIRNVYDAAGTLLQKYITDSAGHTSRYRYWDGFQYKNDSLQFVLHPSGRARWQADSAQFKYDFFATDHLGNVRSVVTKDVFVNHDYFASHEIAAANLEASIFSNIDTVRYPRPDPQSGNMEAARLNGSDPNRTIGTAILLQVMAGDKFDVGAQGYWSGTEVPTHAPEDKVMNSIIATLQGGITTGPFEASAMTTIDQTFSQGNFSTYEGIVDNLTDNSTPRTYINYLVFDDHMNLLPEQSGAIQISSTAGSWQDIHTSTPVTVQQAGYVSIYVSNESFQDTYIDDFTVTIYQGRHLQEQIYYPHGLAINVGEATGPDNVSNKFKFEGNEVEDDLGLNLSNFNNRQYDYQTGRFTSIDPMADEGGQEAMSPYHFCGNDPANNVDPDGLIRWNFDGKNKANSGSASSSGGSDGGMTITSKDWNKSNNGDPSNPGIIYLGDGPDESDQSYRLPIRPLQELPTADLSAVPIAVSALPVNFQFPESAMSFAVDYNMADVTTYISAAPAPSAFNNFMGYVNSYVIPANKFNPVALIANGLYSLEHGKDFSTGRAESHYAAIAGIAGGLIPMEGEEANIGAEAIESLDLQYTKSNLKLGREMHDAYKADLHNPAEQMFKEFRLPSSKRIDFLDVKNGIIYELKPFNPRAMEQGHKQLQMYMEELQTMPRFDGIQWKQVLETY